MTFPLLVRPVIPAERNMVLADWKRDLWDGQKKSGRLTAGEFWCLADHVIDRITFPSSEVFVGCHESEPSVPLCWAALRGPDLIHLHARGAIFNDPEVAAAVERELRSRLPRPVTHVGHLDLFQELRR